MNCTEHLKDGKVALTSGKRVVAVNTKVTSLLNSLSGISTDRLAAKEEDKWGDYQVDSAGTKVQVREGDKLSLDMVVGESGSTSYIRLTGESEVYASDNFKGLRGLDQINNYRDNTFIKLASDSVVAIRFDYPGDSSFQVIKQPGQWNFEDGTPTDFRQDSRIPEGTRIKIQRQLCRSGWKCPWHGDSQSNHHFKQPNPN